MSTSIRRWPRFLVALTPVALALVVACGGAQTPATAPSTAVQATPTAVPAKATPTATPTKAAGGVTPTASASTPIPSAGGSGATVAVEIAPRSFAPSSLSFQKDKTYTLEFSVPAEFHTFTVTDLAIDIYIEAGKTVRRVVTFNKTGTFKLMCTVHEGEGMIGTVTVS